jgi:hypothetical protein
MNLSMFGVGMYCNRCGTQNPDGSANCFNCGRSMDAPVDMRIAASPVVGAQRVRAAELLARIDVAGIPLVVTDDEVTFGTQRMKCDEVVAIRYGVYKHYINGIRDSQSYAIWLTDGRSTISVECAKGLFVRSTTVESRYQEALKALYSAVMVPLIQSLLTNLDKGTGFCIGDVTFDKAGLHRRAGLGSIQKGLLGAWASIAGGRSVDEREQQFQHLSWKEFGGHAFDKGHIHLFRKKEAWGSFVLRDTWNAVCLGPLFDFLNEDGRLWKFVNC